LETGTNLAEILVPMDMNELIKPTATMPLMKAYSIAVAPSSFFQKLRNSRIDFPLPNLASDFAMDCRQVETSGRDSETVRTIIGDS
jgi:hypothetical protein